MLSTGLNQQTNTMFSESRDSRPLSDCHEHSSTEEATHVKPLMSRNKSLFSLASMSTDSSTSSLEHQNTTLVVDHVPSNRFGRDVRRYTADSPEIPLFDSQLRTIMEPHIRQARLLREEARDKNHVTVDASIASAIGVPYIELRRERPFLFDGHMHPLHTLLAESLGVSDLQLIHLVDEDSQLLPLLDRGKRLRFQSAYDCFVTTLCIPLLHSLGMSSGIFHSRVSDKIVYRYEAFPRITVSRPGQPPATEPTCRTSNGQSIGCLTFHIPLTPSVGTSAMYAESFPGREDWHPLTASSFGLGYLFDGARCLHFDLENTTASSRVSLEFSVILYSEKNGRITRDLCSKSHLDDVFSQEGPGFYDEAMLSLRIGEDVVTKRFGKKLMEPDGRYGAPFDRES